MYTTVQWVKNFYKRIIAWFVTAVRHGLGVHLWDPSDQFTASIVHCTSPKHHDLYVKLFLPNADQGYYCNSHYSWSAVFVKFQSSLLARHSAQTIECCHWFYILCLPIAIIMQCNLRGAKRLKSLLFSRRNTCKSYICILNVYFMPRIWHQIELVLLASYAWSLRSKIHIFSIYYGSQRPLRCWGMPIWVIA